MHQTKRLTLRPLDVTDADWIVQEIARPEVHQWLPAVPRPYNKTAAQDFIARVAHLDGYRVIAANDEPGGMVSIAERPRKDGSDQSDWSLGYWLKPASWGRGYMTEAAGAMLHWHFALGDTPVQSGWIVGNTGSENVLTKLGFARTGVVAQDHSLFHGRAMPVIKVRLDQPTWQAVAGRGELV